MFPNSLKYIAPLFPSRILPPLLPSLRLPSFNFLSLRFIDSYGFTMISKNYHEIPYNYEQKYEQKLKIMKNVPKIPFDEPHGSIQNPKKNKNKNQKQNQNENCNGEPMIKKNRNNEYGNYLIDKHYLDYDNFYYHRNNN